MEINTMPTDKVDHEIKRKKQLIGELKLKFSSKKDLHRYLVQSCYLYLPKETCVTLHFLSEILAGRKKAIRIDKLIAMQIPHLSEFTV